VISFDKSLYCSITFTDNNAESIQIIFSLFYFVFPYLLTGLITLMAFILIIQSIRNCPEKVLESLNFPIDKFFYFSFVILLVFLPLTIAHVIRLFSTIVSLSCFRYIYFVTSRLHEVSNPLLCWFYWQFFLKKNKERKKNDCTIELGRENLSSTIPLLIDSSNFTDIY